jgi:hypothetical protein
MEEKVRRKQESPLSAVFKLPQQGRENKLLY